MEDEFTLYSDTNTEKSAGYDEENPEPLPQVYMRLQNYYSSGKYMDSFKKAMRAASNFLQHESQYTLFNKLALVLDVDETALSNWTWIDSNLLSNAYSPARGKQDFTAWQKEGKGLELFPTLELYREAQESDVEVFFITERRESLREITELNLLRAGFNKKHRLIMQPDDMEDTSLVTYKSNERRKIQDEGYHIILNIGDQASDLRGGYAEKKIKLPNPFYSSETKD